MLTFKVRSASAWPSIAAGLCSAACLIGAGSSSAQTASAPAAATQASQSAAELRSVTGVVFAQPAGGQVRVVQQGAKFNVGDTIGTQKGAFALVVFADGSRVALRPESAIAIRGFTFKPEDPAADQMSVQLLKGWLRNVSGQIGKRGNEAAFEMKVTDTTIGIRGTDFAVKFCDEECAAAPPTASEGVLSQSGRLGQVLAAAQPIERLREGVTPDPAAQGQTLFLGDVVGTADSEALLALDDGTRIVLAPRTALALRAEEDERGRRAVRLDVLNGTVRVATPPQAAARLYGLLVNAGELLGVRQDTAVDVSCERPAVSGAFSCAASSALLRRGRSEILSSTGLRPLPPGRAARLAEPGAPPPPAPGSEGSPAAPPAQGAPGGAPTGSPAAPSPATPSGQSPAPTPATLQARRIPADAWDTWAPGAHPMHSLRTLAVWEATQRAQRQSPFWAGEMLLAQAPSAPLNPAPALGPALGPRVGGVFDPLAVPPDAARPQGAGEVAQQGIYTAVFTGRIAVSNPLGSILVTPGQGGFTPIVPTAPPRVLPAAPQFMEKDRELDRSKLLPDQCPR